VCIGETSITSIGMGSVKIFFGQRGMESAFEEFSIEKEGRWVLSLSSTPFPMVRQFAPNPNYLDRKGEKIRKKLKGPKISLLSEDAGNKK